MQEFGYMFDKTQFHHESYFFLCFKKVSFSDLIYQNSDAIWPVWFNGCRSNNVTL